LLQAGAQWGLSAIDGLGPDADGALSLFPLKGLGEAFQVPLWQRSAGGRVEYLMISLVATRLSESGRFSYSIARDGQHPIFTTEDPTAAAGELSRLGVEHPDPLIAHSRNWGPLEIVERKSLDRQE
jgi:hypothetical protein